MTEPKHTPGPLYVVENDLIGGFAVSVEDMGKTSLKPCGVLLTADMICAREDAVLYAAAPELLDALRAVRDGILSDGNWKETRKRVDKLIAKAEGREQ